MDTVEVTVTLTVKVRPIPGETLATLATGIVDQAIGLGIDDMDRQAVVDGDERIGRIESWLVATLQEA